MDKFYDLIIDNIYVFCLIIALLLVILIFLLYLVRVNRYRRVEKEYIDKSVKPKEELEKITDSEIEKRVLEEALQDEQEVKEKLEEIEDNNKGNSAIEEIIDNLKEATPSKASDALKRFEEEQEENAIISYQQLLNAVNKNEEPKNVETSIDNISGDSLEETLKILDKYDNLNEEIDNEPIINKDYSYKPNEFISPVFGRMDSSNVHYREGLSYTDKKEYKPKEVETQVVEEAKPLHADYSFDYQKDDLDIRTKKLDSEEFLKNLKEFRKSL